MNLAPEELVDLAVQSAVERSLVADGVNVPLYFDAGDLRDAVVGLYAFWRPPHPFQSKILRSDRALIWSLYSSQLLGPVRVFTPHQAELLTLMQFSFNLSFVVGADEPHRQDFLRLAERSLAAGGGGEILSFVVGEATRGNWRSRLVELIEAGCLQHTDSRSDYQELVASATFRKLHRVFADRRPEKPSSNFADAAVLCELVEAARRWKRGEDLPELPLFYSSSRLFEEVLELAGLRHELRVPIHGSVLDLLSDAPRLVYRTVRRCGDRWRELQEPMSSLERALTEGDSPNAQEVNAHVLSLNGTLANSFAESMRAVLEEATGSRQAVVPPPAVISKRLRELADKLRASTAAFRRLREVWIGTNESVHRMEKGRLAEVWRERPRESHNLLLVGGLVRFSFAEDCEGAIRGAIETLIQGSESIADLVAGVLARPRKRVRMAEIAKATAVLWVLELDSLLCELLERFEDRHHSLRVLHAASKARMAWDVRSWNEVREMVKSLTGLWASARGRRRAELAIGLAYLEFRVGLSEGFVPSWNRQERAENPLVVAEIRRAVEMAGMAARSEHLRDPQRAWSKNQYLYYMVAGGTESDGALLAAATLLLKVPRSRILWAGTFYDTLARYFFLRYQRESDEPAKDELLSWAFDESERALEWEPNDPEIVAFNEVLRVEKDSRHRLRVENHRKSGQ